MSKHKRRELQRPTQVDKTPPPLPFRRKLLFAAVIVLAVFGMPELLLRLFWEPPPVAPIVGERKFVQWLSQLSVDPRSPKQLYHVDRQRLWSLVPGVQTDSFNPHYDPRAGERQPIRISVNAEGYRGLLYPPQKPSSTLRVLCLGDSNIFGYPLDDAHTFPTALSRALHRELSSTRVEVVNGGIPGYTVLQGRTWYEQQFADYDYDWLVLSYLNNDAWPQPQSDSALMARQQTLPGWPSNLASNIQLVQWVHSWRTQAAWQGPLVPRLSLEEFVAGYRSLIESAKGKGARVLILDFRAYGEYTPYSDALQTLAKVVGVPYVMVMEKCRDALNGFDELKRKYPDQLARAQRRWGRVLETHYHLWMYAEVWPEHLNEAGTSWLADEVGRIVAAHP